MLRKLCDLEWWIEEATAGTDWDAHGERGLQSNGEFTAVDFAGPTTGIDDINDEAEETGIKEQVCTRRRYISLQLKIRRPRITYST
jgi:hypothetical protein